MCVCTSKSLVSCDRISDNDNLIGSSISLDSICDNYTYLWTGETPKGLLGLHFHWVRFVHTWLSYGLGHGT